MAVVAQSSWRTEPDAIVVAQSPDRARQHPAGKVSRSRRVGMWVVGLWVCSG